ncbi:hypothetical protein FOL47_006405 [Perkinsus chesapeaki]|uniref:Glycosyltransferase 2-like domain-containing protein n=1 Tax=Perkinsus chesapeaki TaxID=330153 RepID=A0A7J6LS00_PERCH|nr:hypothetical protein FOL47_006405 [Perkinsus chesapeaki]
MPPSTRKARRPRVSEPSEPALPDDSYIASSKDLIIRLLIPAIPMLLVWAWKMWIREWWLSTPFADAGLPVEDRVGLASVKLSDESKVDGAVTGGLALLLAALSPYAMLAIHWNQTDDYRLKKPSIPYPFLLAALLGIQSSILMSSTADEWVHRALISTEPPSSFEPLWTPPGTVDSVFKNTPSRRLKEVILVDDGSIPPMEPLLAEYRDKACVIGTALVLNARNIAPHVGVMQSFNPVPPSDNNFQQQVRLIRHEQSQGLIRARMAGANAAVGDMVMFLDCHVKPSPGWERPMFKHTNENYKRLVVPLIPRLNGDTWEVQGDEPGVKMMFDWGLQFSWFEDHNDEVPVMSGGLYAITKKWWHESGEYDYDMLLYGAENIEQSVRVWMCGGEIVVARDSRVAHLFRPKFPYKVNDTTVYVNKIRTVEVWFDEWKDRYYQTDEHAYKVLNGMGDVTKRKALRQELQCKSFNWFMNRFEDVFKSRGLLPMDYDTSLTLDAYPYA